MRLEPGVWITPTVRLVRPLGAGGMSTVWVAAHMRLHTQVAVKLLSPALRDDEKSRARFRREGRLWALIQSPHLVQTYDMGELADGTLFMVMEWLEGETLRTRLKRDQRLPPGETLEIVRQLGHALDRAHAVGVVHRDLKPANLFLLRSDHGAPLLKVIDFGVAKSIDNRFFEEDGFDVVTAADESLGTPSYMSPEQLRGSGEVDHRADLWALSVLTYRLLLGELPFLGPDYPSLCFAIVRGVFAPPSRWDERWPEPVDAWFRRAFDLDIDQRFQHAAEAVATLEHALAPLAQAPDGEEGGAADELWDDADTLPR
jgi:eukaryotic-like serine/threonine-protein kinase